VLRHPRPRMLALATALAVLALIAAGCGDDEGDTTVTETVGAESDLPPGQAASGITEEGTQGPKYFSSPSENIGCYVDKSAARCDIRNRDWEPPPEPKSCKKIGLDYGQGIAVGDDHAEFICAGDTALGAPTVLAYGEIAQRRAFVCESQPDGMTCSNIHNGHGFFISKESYRIF
jgi:hypothetical protein